MTGTPHASSQQGRGVGPLPVSLAPIAVGGVTWMALQFGWLPAEPESGGGQLALFGWLLLSTLWCAFRAMSEADVLAHRQGEPMGTVTLTIAAITIEVALVMAMFVSSKEHGPTLPRDAMFGVLMVTLNGLPGIALLVAGWRRKEQMFNVRASGAYLSLIIAFCTIGLALPRATNSAPGGFMSPLMQLFVGFAALVVYLAFLRVQTTSQREFFVGEVEHSGVALASHGDAGRRSWQVVTLMALALATVIALAESVGRLTEGLVRARGLPPEAAGALVALLVLAPEGMAAISAAGRDNVQRTVNILLGSALSSLGLTIPAVLIAGLYLDIPVELGLEAPEGVLLGATLLLCVVNFGSGRVNIMQGLVHLLFFGTYLLLIFD